MFAIDLTLKNTPLPISVEKKEETDAQAVYQKVLDAINSGSPQVLELTCEKQPDKQVAVVVSQISAVTISQRSGANAAGRVPGFFAAASAE